MARALAVVLLLCIATPAAAGVAVTDFRGREIRLAKPAERIVCLLESALSGLYMLGAQDRVVGISRNVYEGQVFARYAALDPRIRDRRLPAPGNWDFVSIEAVAALRPDLVVIWSQQTESIAALEALGIPAYGVFIASKEDVYRELADLGRLTGTEARARERVAWAKAELAALDARLGRLGETERPGTYFLWAQEDLATSCRGSTVDDLIRLAGGRNVCEEAAEHRVVSRERLLAWNPEVVVLWVNDRKDPAHLLADPQWRRVSAARTGRVHELPEVFLTDLWTLKFVHAVKLLAVWLHPERFAGLDLDAEARRMLDALYGPGTGGR